MTSLLPCLEIFYVVHGDHVVLDGEGGQLFAVAEKDSVVVAKLLSKSEQLVVDSLRGHRLAHQLELLHNLRCRQESSREVPWIKARKA